ncbi:MAG TPA: DUF2071 domain-containing protein [Rhodothermales bacterium]
MEAARVEIDRLSIRTRPADRPVMHQVWDQLLFLHWAFPPETIRPLVPAQLELDTFDGRAYVGVAPFTMWGVRMHGLPPLPFISRTHELNVRTYVHHEGIPGVWFFSLDAANPLVVAGARLAFGLPYFQASMHLEDDGSVISYESHRRHPGAPDASFRARWRPGDPIGEAAPGTRDFFLVERYCLYAMHFGKLMRTRIHHRPWPLRTATLEDLTSTMIQSHGLREPSDPPILHKLDSPLDVDVFAPRTPR